MGQYIYKHIESGAVDSVSTMCSVGLLPLFYLMTEYADQSAFAWFQEISSQPLQVLNLASKFYSAKWLMIVLLFSLLIFAYLD